MLHILYHLHSLVISDSASSAAAVYEKFLLGVVGYFFNWSILPNVAYIINI